MSIDIEQIDELSDRNVAALATAPNGRICVGAATGEAFIWEDDADEAVRVQLAGYISGPVVFSLGGKQARIGSWSVDVGSGTATVTNVDIDLLIEGIAFEDRAAPRFYSPRSSASSADGRRLAAAFVYSPSRGIDDEPPYSGPKGQLVLVDPLAGSFVAVLEDSSAGLIRDRALAIDDAHIVAAGGNVKAWTIDGKLIGEDPDGVLMYTDVRISPDGSQFATSRVDGTVALRSFDAVSKPATWSAHSDRAMAVAFHPVLPLLASGGEDKQVKLWKLDSTGAEPELVGWFFADGNVTALAFHTFGDHLLVGTASGVVVTQLSGLKTL